MTRKIGKSDYKTISDAARELGISISTIRRYIRAGTLPRPRRIISVAQSIAVFDDAYIAEASSVLSALKGRIRHVGVSDWDPPPKPPKPKPKGK
jgi:predicted DNA-binding transcriptional regulator AlpA